VDKVAAYSQHPLLSDVSASDEKIGRFLKPLLGEHFTFESELTSFSNRNFKVRSSSGEVFVLRISSDVAYKLSNHTQEIATIRWALQEQLSLLEVESHDEENGFLITRFLPGTSCCAADFNHAVHLERALTLLHRLHSSKTAPMDTTPFDPLRRYEITCKTAAQERVFFALEVHELARCLTNLLSQIPPDRFRQCLCHNDPSPENFFYQDGRLYLHDWELAQPNEVVQH
jgi:thiamine kinase-like enzyme